MRYHEINKKIALFLITLVFLGSSVCASKFLVQKYLHKNVTPTSSEALVIKPTSTPTPEPTPAPAPEATQKEIAKAPPKRSSANKITSKTTPNSNGTKTTTVSEGAISPDELSKIAQGGQGGLTPLDIKFVDETGTNSSLGTILKDYLNYTLHWSNEISSLYQITLRDAGATGWEGQYAGSYTINQSGDITSAYGYIVLNSYYHQSNPNFADYMKLVLSHEYGHHYTLYHKWVDWDIPYGQRFPDQYYSVRPLSKSATAYDYSLGWSNCEAEIIAEDYSYFYSGYSYHAMSGSYGLPSTGTKEWLVQFASGSNAPSPTPTPSIIPTPIPTPIPTVTPTPSPLPVPDSENPTVIISSPATNPYSWTSAEDRLYLRATGSDNISVVKIEVYIDDYKAGEQVSSSIAGYWQYDSVENGSHTVVIKAYDAVGNIGEATVVINKS